MFITKRVQLVIWPNFWMPCHRTWNGPLAELFTCSWLCGPFEFRVWRRDPRFR